MSEQTKSSTVPVGTLHRVKSADPVEVIRPDGRQVLAYSDGTEAAHVLDVSGTYVIGGKSVEVE